MPWANMNPAEFWAIVGPGALLIACGLAALIERFNSK